MAKESPAVPKILLMGPSRAGKTSIRKVIFGTPPCPPQETIFIQPTKLIASQSVRNSTFVQFDIYEFSGHFMVDFPNEKTGATIEKFQKANILDENVGAIVFVLDSQEMLAHVDKSNKTRNVNEQEWRKEIKKMAMLAQAINDMGLSKSISFEIFVHKAEGMPDDKKTDIQREVNTAISENLDDLGIEGFVQCSCHVTSIYDQSVFECFSKVARKLLCNIEAFLENLLDTMVNSSRMVKAYLFDMMSKMCVASDSCICLDRHNELCSDMIDIVTDFSAIYGKPQSFDPATMSVIKLETKSSSKRQNTMLLYLRSVAPSVALVCVIEREAYDGKMGLIDYNVTQFRDEIDDLIRTKLTVAAGAQSENTTEMQHNP